MLEAGALISVNVILIALLSARLRLKVSDWANPAFLTVFTAIAPHYLVRPVYLICDPAAASPTSQFNRGLALFSVALFGLLLGSVIAKSPRLPALEANFWVPRPAVGTIIAVGSVCAMLGVHYVTRGTASIAALASTARLPDNKKIYLEYELGYVFLPLEAAALFGLALAVSSWYGRDHNLQGFSKGLALTVFVGLVGGLPTGSRGSALGPLAVFLVLTHQMYRKISLTRVILPISALLIPVFVGIRAMSSGLTVRETITWLRASGTEGVLREFIDRFHGFDTWVELIEWADGQEPALGRTLLWAFLRPVPRSLLSDKPPSFDVFFSYAVHGIPEAGGGVTIVGGIGEAYYNFRAGGVLLFSFFSGVILYKAQALWSALVKRRAWLWVCLLAANSGFLRGLWNLGIATSAAQRFWFTLVTQALLALMVSQLGGRGGRGPRWKLKRRHFFPGLAQRWSKDLVGASEIHGAGNDTSGGSRVR